MEYLALSICQARVTFHCSLNEKLGVFAYLLSQLLLSGDCLFGVSIWIALETIQVVGESYLFACSFFSSGEYQDQAPCGFLSSSENDNRKNGLCIVWRTVV